jgi:hypothetical protein
MAQKPAGSLSPAWGHGAGFAVAAAAGRTGAPQTAAASASAVTAGTMRMSFELFLEVRGLYIDAPTFMSRRER